MILFPFAKINVGLHILNKRADGFHNIESLILPIPLFDILEIEKSKTDEFTISGFPLAPTSDENLVWKAIHILRKEVSFSPVKIHLHKQIPVQAGLGGGSSDATHTITAICRLFDLKLSNKKRMELSAKIGSDCPFFLNQYAQFVTGKGDILEKFKLNQKALKLLVIIPDFAVSTAAAYRMIKPDYNKMPLKDLLNEPIEKWQKLIKNDFEEVVFKDFPALKTTKEMLIKQGAIYSSLSGSGSAIYGFYSEERKIMLPPNFNWYWLNVMI